MSQPMRDLLHTICRTLEKDEGFVLASITHHNGSTPRSIAAKMVVFPNEEIAGTIGGGLLEFDVIKAAPQVIESKVAQLLTFELTEADLSDGQGMICGGQLTVLIEWIEPNINNIKLFNEINGLLAGGSEGVCITEFSELETGGYSVERCLLKGDDVSLNSMSLPDIVKENLLEKTGKRRTPVFMQFETRNFLIEPISSTGTVYLFGAGHVSQDVAVLAGNVDFRIVVVDDRADYANSERFPAADEIRVVDQFEGAFDDLSINEDSYIVILTRGHNQDRIVLGQALRTNAGYIGMIASRKKRNAVYNALKKAGATAEELESVHSPVGLKIGAETPAEIAVSIVAELIEFRSRTISG
ncbi:MAG: XdhC family protein [Deltaproteobacteria bacterium]|nr:XdhC family protein [Deltaproteobacteria bacterium]